MGLQRLEVRAIPIAIAEQVLLETAQGRSSIADVQTFGDRIDVLVADVVKDEVAVRQAFRESDISIDSIQASDTTLENVFVTRLRQQGSDPLFIPFPRSKSQNPKIPKSKTLRSQSGRVISKKCLASFML